MPRTSSTVRVGTLAIALVVGAAAFAKEIDRRAKDAIDAFAVYCIAQAGSPARAMKTLSGSPLATQLPPDAVQRLQQGRTGGVAWALRSPHDAGLLLEYTPDGICGVRVREAQQSSVQDLLFSMMLHFAKSTKGKLSRLSDKVRTENGRKLTTQTFYLQIGGKKGQITGTTSDRKMGETQHFLTFNFVE